MAWRRIGRIIWTNADLIHWRIYGTQGGDELMWHIIETAKHRVFMRHNIDTNGSVVSYFKYDALKSSWGTERLCDRAHI